MIQRIFKSLKVLIFFNAFFFCVSITNAENIVFTTSPSQEEFDVNFKGTDITEIAEVDGFVVDPNLPIDVLYRKVKHARNLRIAGIVCTVCGGYITIPVIGLPILIAGCRKYRAYNRAGLDYHTVKYKYLQSLQNSVTPTTYAPAYNGGSNSASGKD